MNGVKALHTLTCHPDTPGPKGVVISCDVSRQAGVLTLGFRATGPMSEIVWPGDSPDGRQPWVRRDELWRHSCFEVFGAVARHSAYYEGNFATSGEWAAYGFSAYRRGMRVAEEVEMVSANWRKSASRTDLNAILQIPVAFENADWRLGLCAVIEAVDGTRSFWALRHPHGAPDFHHPDCFALELAAAEQP